MAKIQLNDTLVRYDMGTTETAPASAGNTPEGLTTADYLGVEMAEAQSIHTPARVRDKKWQKSYNAAYYVANRERIRAQQKAWRIANRAKIQASRKGITLDQLNDLIVSQDGCCAICEEPFSATPHIDHDHSCCPTSDACGRCARGLLCDYCNHMLGKARDSIEVLEAGASYLRQHATARGR